VNDPDPWLMHVDLQAAHDPLVDRRTLKYNVLAHDRHGLPVHSALVLLRPEADAPNLTGFLTYRPVHGRSRVEFYYDVVKLWLQPVEPILNGGLGTLPLAPLCDVPRDELPAVIRRMEERVRREADAGEVATLWTSTYILMGLRHTEGVAAQLLRGVRDMKESSTYRAILAEGRLEGKREALLQMGRTRFGPPDRTGRAAIESVGSIRKLDRLLARLLEVSSWDELLASG
jgi:predicted transposase YdaD